MTRRERTGALLLACVRDHDWEVPPPGVERLVTPGSDVAQLLADACRHGVEACVHPLPAGMGELPSRSRARLEEAYFTALQWHVRACHDLAVASDALERAGVPWLTFKGPVLAEAIYVRHDLRSYADLDLLVSPGRLRDATSLRLEGAGGQLLDRNWRLARERMHGELHVRMPMGTTVDLHWHVVNEPQLREAFVVRTEELLARPAR